MPAKFSSDQALLADRVDAILPQTQCTKCGFDGCRPYAEAIATGQADINRCPPGGAANIVRLAALTGRPVRPLEPACGTETPRRVAWIDPERCIGCTRCIPACPVDAIIGAPKFQHAVLESTCTGCDLCLAPCPVDCIEMRPLAVDTPWTDELAATARQRYERHRRRVGGVRVPVGPAAMPVTMIDDGLSTAATQAPDAAAVTDEQAAAERKRQLLAAITARARRNLAERGRQ